MTIRCRPRRFLASGVIALLTALPVGPAFGQVAATEREAMALPLGREVQASQLAGEGVSYSFQADAGASYLIDISQNVLDLDIVLTLPDGSQRRYNSPLERDEHEFVLIEDAEPGIYRVGLSSETLTDRQGTHAILLTRTDRAGATELSAWRSMTLGAAAYASDRRETRLEALGHYTDAAWHWRRSANTRRQAQALYSVAMVNLRVTYDFDAAVASAAAAAERYRTAGDSTLAAKLGFIEAIAQMDVARDLQGSEADTAFERALTLYDASYAAMFRLGNAFELAKIDNFRGLAFYRRGELEKAADFYAQAIVAFANNGEWGERARVQQNLAVIDSDQGYYASAIDTLLAVLAVLPTDRGDLELRAIALENLGGAYRASGSIDQSLEAYDAALDLHQDRDDLVGQAYALRGLGTTYYVTGELDLARDMLEDALQLADRTGEGRLHASVLTGLGNVAYLENDYHAALGRHREALILTNSQRDRANREILIARDLVALDRYEEAIFHASTARESSEKAGQLADLGGASQQLGFALLRSGEADSAIVEFEQALSVFDAVGDDLSAADTLNGLAQALHSTGQLDEALRYSAAALERSDGLRERVASPELRAFFAGSRERYGATHIDLLMERSRDRGAADMTQALAMSERTRSRLTVDLLSESRTAIDLGIDPEIAAERDRLYGELAALQHQRDEVLGREHLSDDDLASIDGLLGEMAILESDLNLLETQLRRTSPRFASLMAPHELTPEEIQALLDDDTTLLQYSLGASRSFVWVVRRNSIVARELPGRETIEAQARRVFDGLRTHRQAAADRRRLRQDLVDLSDLIVAPVYDSLDGRRVLVSVNGALQYIPFGLLPVVSAGQRQALLETHSVVSVPSMSVLAALRTEDDSIDTPRSTLALFADPVLDPEDPRLPAAGPVLAAVQRPASGLLERSSVKSVLGRLPATAREADAIGALVPADRRQIVVGFAASRDTLFGLQLDQYRILHFATHGLVDSRYPELSALALSSFDEAGRPREGYLRLHEIFDLDLNADLVVLSACETALGREIRGDGLIGLVQGFMYAGARSLVVSAWQVPDAATAELMARFYRFMLADGQRPAQALRSAQMSIAAEPGWADPYFWGSFMLVGDWQ